MIQQFLQEFNLEGLAIGLATFLIIGIFHPLVIKGEYYMGQRCNWLFFTGGIVMLILSLVTQGVWSILCGVTSFSCFWSILEVKEQRERVMKGWFPANPKRDYTNADTADFTKQSFGRKQLRDSSRKIRE